MDQPGCWQQEGRQSGPGGKWPSERARPLPEIDYRQKTALDNEPALAEE